MREFMLNSNQIELFCKSFVDLKQLELDVNQQENVYTLLSINPAELWNFCRFYCSIKNILHQKISAELQNVLFSNLFYLFIQAQSRCDDNLSLSRSMNGVEFWLFMASR